MRPSARQNHCALYFSGDIGAYIGWNSTGQDSIGSNFLIQRNKPRVDVEWHNPNFAEDSPHKITDDQSSYANGYIIPTKFPLHGGPVKAHGSPNCEAYSADGQGEEADKVDGFNESAGDTFLKREITWHQTNPPENMWRKMLTLRCSPYSFAVAIN
jgi:hypothetical protein